MKSAGATCSSQFYLHIIVEIFIPVFMHLCLVQLLLFIWWRKIGTSKIFYIHSFVPLLINRIHIKKSLRPVYPHWYIKYTLKNFASPSYFCSCNFLAVIFPGRSATPRLVSNAIIYTIQVKIANRRKSWKKSQRTCLGFRVMTKISNEENEIEFILSFWL